MYLQEILEVGVGLVFLWLVISIAAMQLQEWLANLLRWRGRDLKRAIGKMLADAQLTEAFYSHQVIRGLSKDLSWNDLLWQQIVNGLRRLMRRPPRSAEHLPSYIPSSEFVRTLFDLLLERGDNVQPVREAFAAFRQALAQRPPQTWPEERRSVFYQTINSIEQQSLNTFTEADPQAFERLLADVRLVLADSSLSPEAEKLMGELEAYARFVLTEGRTFLPESIGTMRRLRNGMLAVGFRNAKLYQSLRALWNGLAETALTPDEMFLQAQQSVETWFNNAMARLSGWYKRRAQLASFLLGLLLALLFNVDSIYVSINLWREPTLRQIIVQQAEMFAQRNAAPTTDATPPVDAVRQVQDQLQALMIPFGWQTETYVLQPGETCRLLPYRPGAVWGVPSGQICKRIANAPTDRTGWMSKVGGWLLTAMAAAQGAPFWFDLLKRLVNVRSSGPNPNEQKPAA